MSCWLLPGAGSDRGLPPVVLALIRLLSTRPAAFIHPARQSRPGSANSRRVPVPRAWFSFGFPGGYGSWPSADGGKRRREAVRPAGLSAPFLLPVVFRHRQGLSGFLWDDLLKMMSRKVSAAILISCWPVDFRRDGRLIRLRISLPPAWRPGRCCAVFLLVPHAWWPLWLANTLNLLIPARPGGQGLFLHYFARTFLRGGGRPALLVFHKPAFLPYALDLQARDANTGATI